MVTQPMLPPPPTRAKSRRRTWVIALGLAFLLVVGLFWLDAARNAPQCTAAIPTELFLIRMRTAEPYYPLDLDGAKALESGRGDMFPWELVAALTPVGIGVWAIPSGPADSQVFAANEAARQTTRWSPSNGQVPEADIDKVVACVASEPTV